MAIQALVTSVKPRLTMSIPQHLAAAIPTIHLGITPIPLRKGGDIRAYPYLSGTSDGGSLSIKSTKSATSHRRSSKPTDSGSTATAQTNTVKTVIRKTKGPKNKVLNRLPNGKFRSKKK